MHGNAVRLLLPLPAYQNKIKNFFLYLMYALFFRMVLGRWWKKLVWSPVLNIIRLIIRYISWHPLSLTLFSILIVIFITMAAGRGCTHTKTEDSRLVFLTKMWSDKLSDVLVMSLLWKETESFNQWFQSFIYIACLLLKMNEKSDFCLHIGKIEQKKFWRAPDCLLHPPHLQKWLKHPWSRGKVGKHQATRGVDSLAFSQEKTSWETVEGALTLTFIFCYLSSSK